MSGQHSPGRWTAAGHRWLPGLTWALLLFALGLVRMFVPRAIGLADNGGGAALACRLGIAPEGGTRYFTFVVFRWVAGDDPSCTVAGTPPPWPQLAGLTIARVVSTALGTGTLDLRVSSVAYCALAALAAALVGQATRRRRYGRAVTTALTWVLLMDASFAGYAASLYPQAAGIAGLILCTAGWLLLDSAGRVRWAGRAALGLGSAVLVSSGPVAALAVVPIGVALAVRARRSHRNGEPGPARPLGRMSRDAPVALTVALTVVLTALAAGAVAGVGPEQRKYDTWDYVSMGVLADAARPGPELTAMGLPSDAARFLRIPVWSASSIRGWERWPDVDPSPVRVWGYVLSHPAVLYDRLDDTVRAMGDGRPDGLGSFDADTAGPLPGEQEQRVTLFSSRQAQLVSAGLPAAALCAVLLGWLALVIARSPVHGRHARRLASAALVLLGIAASQVVGTAFTEATDAARHVVVGSLAGLLSLCLLVAAGLTSRALDAAARPEAEPAHV